MSNEKSLTLGSLFDGSGGFPLAAEMCGITPVWASEIDPFCVQVTSKRFPEMKHLGDITKVNGGSIPPVNIITFGSPCQDLSVAGNRAGLDGSRSSLFLEAIRIFKEMREATNGIYPNVVVWENVPGAYSSHKGEDFRRVLEEIAGVTDPNVQFLDLRAENGTLAGALWETVTALPGEHWTLNTGESPKDVRESFLSRILEEDAPRKYYLSAAACKGILRRAEKRGKELPPLLKSALEYQISRQDLKDKQA